MEGQCKAVRGEKQSMWDGKRGAERGCWEEGVGEAGVQRRTMGCIERGAGQQNHLRGRSGLRRQHIPSLKSLSETYRPECKSWHLSNTSWNLCSALYARMVQSPRREDAKWENTGLRAGEAETDTRQRKSGRLDARKPTASWALGSHVLPKDTPVASWWAA